MSDDDAVRETLDRMERQHRTGTSNPDPRAGDPLNLITPEEYDSLWSAYYEAGKANPPPVVYRTICPGYHVGPGTFIAWIIVTITFAYFGAHALMAAGVGT